MNNSILFNNYTLGLVIGQALVIGQLDVFILYFALKLYFFMHNIIDIYPTHKIDQIKLVF
jgi:hypothetical protein